ncbi:hypothetical protein [Dyadobacter sp. CY312]|uniref:hypothetical protein n=1 Tax=Dyadobacter sp. CY312 TaxID=2907303 RepID=UPI001F3434B5|nr:hypothetical protein [Dyadobacter sp. CY312]
MKMFYNPLRNRSLGALSHFVSFTCFFYCMFFVVGKSTAQCDFDSPGVSLNTTTFDGTNCQVNIDLSFDLESNNGNKFIFVHLWTLDGYTASHPIPYSSAPTSTQLGNALATLVIDNTNAIPVLLEEYRADAAVSPMFTGITITKGGGLNAGFDRYTVTNLTLTIPGSCNSVPSLKGDAWSTNANSQNPTVHCSTLGFQLVNNDIELSGNLNCNDPASNSYDIDVTTTATTPFEINYKVYLDDGDGILEAGTTDNEIEAGTAMISSVSPLSLSDVLYAHTEIEKIRSLWVVVDGQAVPYFSVEELVSTCILPVKMTYFNVNSG